MRKLYQISWVIFWVIAWVSSQAQIIESKPDEMPYFTGCDHLPQGSAEKRNCSNRNLVQFIQDHIVYPDSAKANGIEGTVYLRFQINHAGIVTNPILLYDIGMGCGQEALRVLERMPAWTPAIKDRKPVPVMLELPMVFEFDNKAISGYSLIWGELSDREASKRTIRQQLSEPISVRTSTGDQMDILELRVVILRKNKILREKVSDGQLTKKQKKYIRRAKKRQSIEIIGTIQKAGAFHYVTKEIIVQ